MLKIYEDYYYTITQHPEYKNIPGFYVINENNCSWDESVESINRLPELEKCIRDYLLEIGVELVGIYKEQTDSGFQVYLIPYHISVLEKNCISPDLYQPYISKYLNSFDEKYKEEVIKYNNQLVKKLNK